MGNSNSNYVNLVLNPPDPLVKLGGDDYYIAGRKVYGTCYISAPEGAQAKDIQLLVYFTGKEDVCVRYHETEYYTDSSGNRKSRRVSKYEYAKRDICRISIDVAGAGTPNTNDFQQGNYAFPFSFDLPKSLPTSMFHSGDGGRCSIVYKVKAELKGKWRNRSNEVEIDVIAVPPDSEPVPTLVNPSTERVKTCCCFDRGSITFGASIDDTRVGNGEEIKIDMGCKNESATDITSVKAEIYESVSWHGYRHNSFTNKVISKKEFQKTDLMAKKEKREMQIIRSEEKNGTRSLSGDDGLFREIYQMLHDGENSTILSLPMTILHDYSGSCIQVSHLVTLTINTPCCSRNPSSSVVLNVVSPKSVEQALLNSSDSTPSAPELPQGWEADNVFTLPTVSSTINNTYLGGSVTSSEQDINLNNVSLDTSGPTGVSLEALSHEMQRSINAKTTITDKIGSREWAKFFKNLSPMDYSVILKNVSSEFDQPDVAYVVAGSIGTFSSNHIVAMLRVVSESMRVTALQKTLPLCKDALVNKNTILAELSDWERICTEYDFSKLN
jgi:hypothetical protein